VSAQRPDNLQQVAPPSELYANPVNMFVAGFIGSPAMNMAYATLESDATGLYVKFGEERLLVDQKALDRHPGLAEHAGELVMGIRPGNFEATSITGPAPDRTITAPITVAEILGSETFVHFELETPPVVTPDIEELLADTGANVSSLGNTTKFTARVSSDVAVALGQDMTLTVDTAKMHFFDPNTGMRVGARN
jgi:multiple sugar transport system ATP-binding protein